MRSRWVLILASALALGACDGDGDDAVTAPVGTVRNFGPSPLTACPNPEGVAVDPNGDVWTGSAPGGGGAPAATAAICRLDRRGQVVDTIPLAAGASGAVNVGGLYFAPGDGLYFTDFGDFGPGTNKRVLRLDPATRAVTVIASDLVSPNALTRDLEGNLYVSDSALGTVFRIAPDAARTRTVWKTDPLLLTDNAALPFGANGIAFDAARQFLYVAVTGEAAIVRIARNADGSAGAAALFASGAALGGNALAGADGIAFDDQGNLYVCANQANEIQVLSVSGTPQITQRYAGQGADAFVFPSSIAFRGNQAYVANLSFGSPGGKLSLLGTPSAGAVYP
jgi:sugar lactone lactonase YvrE